VSSDEVNLIQSTGDLNLSDQAQVLSVFASVVESSSIISIDDRLHGKRS